MSHILWHNTHHWTATDSLNRSLPKVENKKVSNNDNGNRPLLDNSKGDSTHSLLAQDEALSPAFEPRGKGSEFQY